VLVIKLIIIVAFVYLLYVCVCGSTRRN